MCVYIHIYMNIRVCVCVCIGSDKLLLNFETELLTPCINAKYKIFQCYL